MGQERSLGFVETLGPCIFEASGHDRVVRQPARLLTAVALSVNLAVACSTARDEPDTAPVYRGEVDAVLSAKCARCHAGAAPAGGWRADTYIGAIGCTATGAQAAKGGPDAPIARALARPDHAGFASATEGDTLRRWLEAGARSRREGVHSAAFTDPRSPESHGQLLRARRYRPMLDVTDADACGRCHDGAPARPPKVSPADEATACTTCHTEPGGPLGCGTCHGGPGRAYPPRDPCFFPGDAPSPAHAAHAGSSAAREGGLACATCHPTPASGEPAGAHANTHVEVWLDPTFGRTGAFDPATKRCADTCHARGGARPTPSWTGEARMACGDCHGAPPAGHYAGACTSCHREANEAGTALTASRLHLNGVVDLGDGSGACGACHGSGADPWPSTGAHAAHARPSGAAPVACETCHEVPAAGARHPRGGGATVRLSGLAVRGGRRAAWDPATKTCAGTYCHEGAGARAPAPRWTDGPAAATCGACHATPPPAPHAAASTCASAGCHEGATTPGGDLTPAARAVHVNGRVDARVP